MRRMTCSNLIDAVVGALLVELMLEELSDEAMVFMLLNVSVCRDLGGTCDVCHLP